MLCDRLLGPSPSGVWALANGQTGMVLVTLLAVFPLSCQKHMRSLESAAAAGMAVVVALLAWLAYKASAEGFPAVADGQFSLWSLQVRLHCACLV